MQCGLVSGHKLLCPGGTAERKGSPHARGPSQPQVRRLILPTQNPCACLQDSCAAPLCDGSPAPAPPGNRDQTGPLPQGQDLPVPMWPWRQATCSADSPGRTLSRGALLNTVLGCARQQGTAGDSRGAVGDSRAQLQGSGGDGGGRWQAPQEVPRSRKTHSSSSGQRPGTQAPAQRDQRVPTAWERPTPSNIWAREEPKKLQAVPRTGQNPRNTPVGISAANTVPNATAPTAVSSPHGVTWTQRPHSLCPRKAARAKLYRSLHGPGLPLSAECRANTPSVGKPSVCPAAFTVRNPFYGRLPNGQG